MRANTKSIGPGRVIVLRGDAAHLPMPDASVDLIVTSPPFWQLRSYTDGGAHYEGQIGSEATFQEYIASLVRCTREWVRVLKPEGSLFVELGDKYSDRGHGPNRGNGTGRGPQAAQLPQTRGPMEKCLLDLPARYSIACVDELGLIKRANIVWHHVNGLPESVTDRVRAAHSMVFHFVKQPRYFAAVDEVREPQNGNAHARRKDGRPSPKNQAGLIGDVRRGYFAESTENPLGKLPGSVWDIASQPLAAPDYLGVDHFAAFPMELPRRIILGWSPAGICAECDEGRQPVISSVRMLDGEPRTDLPAWAPPTAPRRVRDGIGHGRFRTDRRLTGYACSCAPYTDHPGTGEPSGPYGRHADAVKAGTYENVGAGWGGAGGLGDRPRVGPWREYHLDRWTPPPTRPAVVVDPFGGTGTTGLVASVLGRTGIVVDRSADYCRLAAWRTTDPAERARALGVPKPPPVIDGQGSLFDAEEAS